MVSILVLHISITLILSLLVFVIFSKFNLNNKLKNKTKLNINYGGILILIIILVFNFILKPNVLDKIQGYRIFTNFDSKSINKIYLERLQRNDHDGKIYYDKKEFKFSKIDTIESLLSELKKMNLGFPERVKPYGFRWVGKITSIDSSVFYFQLIQNEDDITIIPYYKNGVVSFYRNDNLSIFLKSLKEID
ncbi:hypothetical protein AEQU3_02229 [Aequorivita antarctica]|nr:hypothetical protein AEQU3_02229 [Aequorivita antarctica]